MEQTVGPIGSVKSDASQLKSAGGVIASWGANSCQPALAEGRTGSHHGRVALEGEKGGSKARGWWDQMISREGQQLPDKGVMEGMPRLVYFEAADQGSSRQG